MAALRREISGAEIKAAVAEIYHSTPYQTPADTFLWLDYADACREAITWLRQIHPKPQPTKGRIDTEAIKASNDIAAIIEQYTPLHKAGRNFSGLCPIHGDKNPSLAVYPDQQTFHCFGCQRGGDVISFIQEMENTDFRGAAAILGGV